MHIIPVIYAQENVFPSELLQIKYTLAGPDPLQKGKSINKAGVLLIVVIFWC